MPRKISSTFTAKKVSDHAKNGPEAQEEGGEKKLLLTAERTIHRLRSNDDATTKSARVLKRTERLQKLELLPQ